VALVFFDSIIFFISLLETLITVRVIMSWLNSMGSVNSFSKLIFDLTEFLLFPLRKLLLKIMPKNFMIDFSPVLAYILLELLKTLVKDIFKNIILKS